jgi:hypothetical protein
MAHHGHEPAPGAAAESVAAGYELLDIPSSRPIWLFIISIFGLLLFAYVLGIVLVSVQGAQVRDASHAVDVNSPQVPPGPRIEGDPTVDGERIVREATERLESYGWVNQRQGIAHVPIERAMELLLDKGVRPFEE